MAVAAQSVRTEVLGNGLTLILQKQRLTHALELRLVVRAGPTYEDDLLGSGVSDLLRGVLAESSRHLTDGRLRSVTAVDHTAFSLTVPDDQLESGLGTLASLVSRRVLDAADFRTVQTRQLDRLRRLNGDAGLLEERLLRNLIYQRHPARLPVAGLPEQLAELELAQIQGYFRQRYTANNLILVVVGNVEREAWLRQLVEKSFGGLRTGSWRLDGAEDEPQQLAERSLVRGGVAKQRDVIAWRTLPVNRATAPRGGEGAGDRNVCATLEVVAELLADPVVSPLHRALGNPRLVDRLRIEHHLPGAFSGYLAISYDPLPEKAPQALKAVNEVLERLATEGPEARALDAAKAGLRRRWRQREATVAASAAELSFWYLATGDASWGEQYRRHLEGVTPADVAQVVDRWLRPSYRNRTRLVLDPQVVVDTQAPVGSPVAKVDPAPTETDLVAGARLLSKRIDQYGLVHLGVVVGGGRSATGADLSGVAGIVAGLLRKGSTGLQGAELDSYLAVRGMELHSAATIHGIEVQLTCFPDQVEEAIDLLVRILRDPAMPQEALDTARGLEAARAQQALGKDGNWRDMLQATIRKALLPDHYGGILPSKDSIEALTRDRVRTWFAEQVVGQRLVFSLWGDFIELEPVAARLRNALDEPDLPTGEAWAPQGAPWPGNTDVPRISQRWERDEAALSFTWHGPALDELDADGPAVAVLSSLMRGRGIAGGIIAGALLDEPGVTLLDIDVVSEAYAGRGLWTVMIRYQGATHRKAVEDKVSKALEGLRNQLAQPDGLAAADLAIARRRCEADRILGGEDLARSATAHGYAALLGRLAQHHAGAGRIAAVTAADLARVAARYLSGPPAVVELVGDGPEIAPVPPPPPVEPPPAGAKPPPGGEKP